MSQRPSNERTFQLTLVGFGVLIVFGLVVLVMAYALAMLSFHSEEGKRDDEQKFSSVRAEETVSRRELQGIRVVDPVGNKRGESSQ